jgi:archaellum component FlaC
MELFRDEESFDNDQKQNNKSRAKEGEEETLTICMVSSGEIDNELENVIHNDKNKNKNEMKHSSCIFHLFLCFN